MHILYLTTIVIFVTATLAASIDHKLDIHNQTSQNHNSSKNITLQSHNATTKTDNSGCVEVQNCQSVKTAAPSNASTNGTKDHCHANGWPCIHFSSCCSEICQWTWPAGYPIPIRQCA
ncbi:hypothetical protein BDV35DRAFT_334388 [Aspergillus flavus]|uniref:Uncharacterized protein n=1 Tax=Aspergillus flavus TaxID=5059 RepID=A0A5N6HH36_ASPFL|nr:hypothetical protein BDV35DRAFT_334388 [Aspergillus flavus]